MFKNSNQLSQQNDSMFLYPSSRPLLINNTNLFFFFCFFLADNIIITITILIIYQITFIHILIKEIHKISKLTLTLGALSVFSVTIGGLRGAGVVDVVYIK